MHTRILLLILLSVPVGRVLAQQSLGVTPNTVSSSNTGMGKFYYANRNDPPRAIEFKEKTVSASQFLANINNYLAISSAFTFVEVESNTDNLGMRHHLLQQYCKGVPVEGMIYRVHEKNGFVTSANGKAIRNINPETQSTVTEEQAFQLAVKYLQTKDSTRRAGRKLIVSKGFTFTPESFSVAYQFDIDVSLLEQWRISIDARTGQLLNKVSLVNSCSREIEPPPVPYDTGRGRTNYYGNRTIRVEKFQGGSSRLVGKTESGGTIGTYDFRHVNILSLLLFFEYHKVYDFYSGNNIYDDPYYRPAVSVQWAAEQAFEYYFKKHNRNSFDNNGSAIKSYVHVDEELNNAFWTHNLLAFGDGSNNNPLVELDVVAHELTHGVTQYEANLQYYNEPGALNESFSDILGKAVEFHTFGDTATWQMGKHYRDGGMRDFSNPNLKNQPDTYAGDMWYTGYEDSGGVHYNSGVQNFWFYLLCEGGSGTNDHQLSYSVQPIGMDPAVKIAYRNLTEYLGNFSDYLDSRLGSLLATADLYGKNSNTYQQVANAWDAVGVVDEPIITSLQLYDITATTVKIKGSLLPRGDTVTYHFEYGTTPALGSSSPIYKYTDKVEGIVTGLQSETKYYLRLVATNENGSSYVTTEFTTISLAPLVKIKETVDVTETTATLYGQINPNSLPTSFYFEYGLTPALGLTTPSYPIPDTTEFLDISAVVVNLQPRKTYYYRLVAVNSFASSATGPESFFTAVKPVIISYAPVAAPVGAEVTITGSNFNPTREKNIVSFGATRGTLLSSSSTEIKVKVPAGASFGTISILDAESGLAVESTREFVPTFTGEFKKESLQLRVGLNEPSIWKALVQDMDGDNKPDIVTAHYQGFSVFQNVNQGGDITIESFVRNTYNIPDFSSSDLYVVDLDGNGLKDIVGRYQNSLRLYQNLSVPGFVFFSVPVDLHIEYLTNLTFNDFDLDGHVDIAGVTPMGDHSTITIFRNQNPKGSLSANNFEKRSVKVLSHNVEFLTAGDLNNDGSSDLVAASNYQDSFSIMKNNSHPGTFEFEESIVSDPTRADRFVRYVSHDLNQDGWKDIISHSPYLMENFSLMENKRTSPNVSVTTPPFVLGEYETVVQPGDINGDGKVDLVLGRSDRSFHFLENKVAAGAHLSNSSFEKFAEFGMALVNTGSGSVDTKMTINDLNGDGRPEIINAYSYNFGPHDGYQMEIWQNSPNDCLDPSLISLNVSNYTATIVLPPNTTLDQFDIEYSTAAGTYWWPVYSTTLYNLSPGYAYQLRARAKCYLGFTGYHYINFKTDCVNTDSFSVSTTGVSDALLSAYDLGSFEIQYSEAGKDEWKIQPQYSNTIANLLPGTTYDVRFRGRCYSPSEFKYKQFTTLCPKLSTLSITDLTYNKAVVSWTANYTGDAILEYSTNNVDWTLINDTRTMFPLVPGKQYFVRGTLACTDTLSDFIYKSFITPCPTVSLNIDAVTPFSAKVSWVDESETGSYTLSYSTAAGGSIKTVSTGTTSFSMDGLTPGTQYSVSVAPTCNMAQNFTSINFSTVCYVPFNLLVGTVTHTTAELSWSDNFGGVPYSVDYSISGSNVWQTATTSLTNISLVALRPGTEYEARVHINCVSETAAYVSQFFETSLYQETTFAPNPTASKITIRPSKDLIGNRFAIHDNVGRILISGELRDYTIDLSNFSDGIYTLRIEGERIMKIVKR